MDTRDLAAIISIIRSYRAEKSVCVVELGSGVSTLVLAHVVSRLFKGAHVISVEGEESYVQRLQDQLKGFELDDVVSLLYVPYVKSDDACWFSRDALRRILADARVDILIVDAPPDTLCHQARQPAIPFFIPYLKQGSMLLLHDAYRRDQYIIKEEWDRYFSASYVIHTPRGIEVFVGNQNVEITQ